MYWFKEVEADFELLNVVEALGMKPSLDLGSFLREPLFGLVEANEGEGKAASGARWSASILKASDVPLLHAPPRTGETLGLVRATTSSSQSFLTVLLVCGAPECENRGSNS
jgi:hypothetical protein